MALGGEFQRQIGAIAIRQHDVGKQQFQVVGMAAEGEDGFGGISRVDHAVPSPAQDLSGHFTNERFILHQEDGYAPVGGGQRSE